jgi:Arm domain-containing DNA-binding protein
MCATSEDPASIATDGLYLVVDPSGAKRWMVRTVILGKRCDLGVGSVRLVSLRDQDRGVQMAAAAALLPVNNAQALPTPLLTS